MKNIKVLFPQHDAVTYASKILKMMVVYQTGCFFHEWLYAVIALSTNMINAPHTSEFSHSHTVNSPGLLVSFLR